MSEKLPSVKEHVAYIQANVEVVAFIEDAIRARDEAIRAESEGEIRRLLDELTLARSQLCDRDETIEILRIMEREFARIDQEWSIALASSRARNEEIQILREQLKHSHEVNDTEVVIPSKTGLQYHFYVPAEVARELHRLHDIVEGILLETPDE
jgi:hypothetical protein